MDILKAQLSTPPQPARGQRQPSRWSSPWKHRDMKLRVCQPHHPSHGSCLASPRVQFGLETRYFYQIRCQSCSNVGSEDWIINKRTCAPPLSGCSAHCSIPCQPADLMRPNAYSEHSLAAQLGLQRILFPIASASLSMGNIFPFSF